jgi:chloramphenicol 3-O phosphotransferase
LTAIARLLQVLLPDAGRRAVDDLIRAMPPRLLDGEGLRIDGDGQGAGGTPLPGPGGGWLAGIAAMVGQGAGVIVDDVFLGAAETQARWRPVLTGRTVVWVGVHGAPTVAVLRA